MVKIIYLTQNRAAIVDDEDYEFLNQFNWSAKKDGSTFYSVSNFRLKSGKRKLISMHRLLLDAREGEIIDHINGNGLDNRKSNLRFVTQRQNLQNKQRSKTSRYPGVTKRKNSKKWASQIRINNKEIHLGYFKITGEKVVCELGGEAV